MKILVIGSGGREHAIVRKLKESPRVTSVICAPGNGGIACDAQCFAVDVKDKVGMLTLAKEKQVDFVVVAPDDPLADGMVDLFEDAGFRTFGPRQSAAEIESSKVFSKNLMRKYQIPTAEYQVFTAPEDALRYLEEKNEFPTVIKADGLALGKGVIIAQTLEEAQDAVRSMMQDKVFGASGNKIVIEEFLQGPEVSVLAFCDGKTVVPMVSSMDHKRALDGDKGLNTGGMGTISPNPYYSQTMAEICMQTIFLPTVAAMNSEGRPFKGCLYFGLMLTKNGPKVIEYNARFGDPETQVVLPRLKTPLIDIMEAVADETLDQLALDWDDKACACVMMASGGYPERYEKGKAIRGLNEEGQLENLACTVFHSGTLRNAHSFVTNGGRVLGVSACGATLEEALRKAYGGVAAIEFEQAHYRKDIGRTEQTVQP